MINETLKLVGRLSVVLTGQDGCIKQSFDVDNLVVQVGKNFAANALVATSTSPFTYMAIGTNGTAASLSDTTLGTELTRIVFSSATVSTNIATFVATFAAGVGTGALQEAGLLNASTAGVLLSHVVFAVVNKGSADSLTITWTITAG